MLQDSILRCKKDDCLHPGMVLAAGQDRAIAETKRVQIDFKPPDQGEEQCPSTSLPMLKVPRAVSRR